MSRRPHRRSRAAALAGVHVLLAIAVVAGPAAAAVPSAVKQARKIGAAAYVYGVPVVAEAAVLGGSLPNRFFNLTRPATPAARLVARPNVDTLYSNARLELAAGPVVVHVPETAGRYYALQLVDAYTNTFGYIGRRATGTQAGDFAITPPGWSGTLPAGVAPISAPTPMVWLLGRTLVGGPDDLAAVHEIQRGYTLTPLRRFGGRPNGALFLPGAAAATPELPAGLAFFDALSAAMTRNPPPAQEEALLRRFASVGIGPGQTTSTAPLSPAVRDGLLAGMVDGQRRIDRYAAKTVRASRRRHHGWLVPPAAAGAFGTNYLLRAYAAREGIGMNRPVEAMYPTASVDSKGRALTGGHRYVLRFARGGLPPVDGFWSLTMYDRTRFLVPNPLDRSSIGDRTPGLVRGEDGSLAIRLQAGPPAGGTSNWLPAPSGRFTLTLRLYQPRASALTGTWRLPTIKRVG